jgi:hypothetical protein
MPGPQAIGIGSDGYERCMQEINSLSAKKQKLWKSWLTDQQGQRTKLIYRDGKLLNYCIPRNDYVEVYPITPETKLNASSPLGALVASGIGIDQSVDLMRRVLHPHESDAHNPPT